MRHQLKLPSGLQVIATACFSVIGLIPSLSHVVFRDPQKIMEHMTSKFWISQDMCDGNSRLFHNAVDMFCKMESPDFIVMLTGIPGIGKDTCGREAAKKFAEQSSKKVLWILRNNSDKRQRKRLLDIAKKNRIPVTAISPFELNSNQDIFNRMVEIATDAVLHRQEHGMNTCTPAKKKEIVEFFAEVYTPPQREEGFATTTCTIAYLNEDATSRRSRIDIVDEMVNLANQFEPTPVDQTMIATDGWFNGLFTNGSLGDGWISELVSGMGHQFKKQFDKKLEKSDLHVTLEYQPAGYASRAAVERLKTFLQLYSQPVLVKLLALVCNGKSLAFHVELVLDDSTRSIPGLSDVEYPHITLAYCKGATAKESKEMIKEYLKDPTKFTVNDLVHIPDEQRYIQLVFGTKFNIGCSRGPPRNCLVKAYNKVMPGHPMQHIFRFHELMHLLRNTKYRMVYFDLDGVLADFDNGCKTLMIPTAPVWKMFNAIAKAVSLDKRAFWTQLEEIPEGFAIYRKVLAIVRKFPALWKIGVLTGLPTTGTVGAICGKHLWCEKHLPEVKHYLTICTWSKTKCKFCKPGDILIDDRAEARESWESAGGVFVHFDIKNIPGVIGQLIEVGLYTPE